MAAVLVACGGTAVVERSEDNDGAETGVSGATSTSSTAGGYDEPRIAAACDLKCSTWETADDHCPAIPNTCRDHCALAYRRLADLGCLELALALDACFVAHFEEDGLCGSSFEDCAPELAACDDCCVEAGWPELCCVG